MTDNEIVKELERRKHGFSPISKIYKNLTDAINLINRQKVEIERLNNEVDRLSQTVMYNDSITDLKTTEAIREFAEKVKSNCEWFFGYNISRNKLIDGIVKEMTEENENNA